MREIDMKILDTDVPRIGMGCWAIGGPFSAGDESWAYSNTDDRQSERAIHAALDAGVLLFDTAPAYGAGHSERLLGKALKNHHDALVVTKLGVAINSERREVIGEDSDAHSVASAVDASLERLQREHIDVLLLHLNSLSIDKAGAIFDAMEKVVQAGKVRTFGWSTDYPASVKAMASRPNFTMIEHGMNIFMDVPTIQSTAESTGLTALIRSPLAMGVLTGKYGASSRMPENDIRSTGAPWMEYFENGQPSPRYLANLERIRELLRSNGRTLAQGALCWLLAKREFNLPVPGARTAEQALENAGAIQAGPLPENIMHQIEALIDREPEGVPRDR